MSLLSAVKVHSFYHKFFALICVIAKMFTKICVCVNGGFILCALLVSQELLECVTQKHCTHYSPMVAN